MTNLQLLLTIGIPSLLVILSWISGSKRMERIEATMDANFGKVDSKMDRNFARVDDRLDRIDADLRQFYHLTGKLEGRIESLEKQQ